MMKKVIMAMFVLGLTGCANMTNAEKHAVILGGVGLVAGAQFGATQAAIGLLLGTAAGHAIGNSMDEEDRRRVAQSLDDNETVVWKNPKTGNIYRVTPGEGKLASATDCKTSGCKPVAMCRKVTFEGLVHTTKTKKERHTIHSYACRDKNRNWVEEKIG